MTIEQPQKRRRDRAARGTWWTLARRRWLYGIALAAVPVLLAFGIATEQQLAALSGLSAAVLSIGTLALANPTK